MGCINGAEIIARGEKKERNVYPNSGGHTDAGREGQVTGYQQERINRANSSQSNILCAGTTVVGGMLDQLISDYCDQLASKDNEISHFKRVIEGLELEKKRLESRVREFEALREELKRNIELNS